MLTGLFGYVGWYSIKGMILRQSTQASLVEGTKRGGNMLASTLNNMASYWGTNAFTQVKQYLITNASKPIASRTLPVTPIAGFETLYGSNFSGPAEAVLQQMIFDSAGKCGFASPEKITVSSLGSAGSKCAQVANNKVIAGGLIFEDVRCDMSVEGVAPCCHTGSTATSSGDKAQVCIICRVKVTIQECPFNCMFQSSGLGRQHFEIAVKGVIELSSTGNLVRIVDPSWNSNAEICQCPVPNCPDNMMVILNGYDAQGCPIWGCKPPVVCDDVVCPDDTDDTDDTDDVGPDDTDDVGPDDTDDTGCGDDCPPPPPPPPPVPPCDLVLYVNFDGGSIDTQFVPIINQALAGGPLCISPGGSLVSGCMCLNDNLAGCSRPPTTPNNCRCGNIASPPSSCTEDGDFMPDKMISENVSSSCDVPRANWVLCYMQMGLSENAACYIDEIVHGHGGMTNTRIVLTDNGGSSECPFYVNTPISLAWENPNIGVSDKAAAVQFPLDLSESYSKKWFRWFGSDRYPLLVYDPEHKGNITSPSRLFGNFTFGKVWESGYDALATLDINKDKVVSDQELKDLGLWFDSNRDGISQKGEVKSLSELKVTKLFYEADGSLVGSGNAFVLNGFEREVDGKKITGSSIDWLASGGFETKEQALKHKDTPEYIRTCFSRKFTIKRQGGEQK